MGKSAERKRNEKDIRVAGQSFDKSKAALKNFKFEDQYAGLEATQAQAGTLGAAQGYDAATAQAGTLGAASQATAQGYESQGYDAAQASAAQAAKTNLGEDTGRTNQFGNLQVNTAAADRQGQATDAALAAQQEAGGITGGGGATALAAAAAASKQGISDTISQQETQNNQLRAQGATSVQQENLAQRNTSRQANIQQDQYNTSNQQQVNLANQSATNQASQFTAGAANQAAQFGAAAANQASQFNASSNNQFAQAQFSADNQFALSNQNAQNASYQFGANAQNQFAQSQFGADNQFSAQNAASSNQFAITKAQGASQNQDNQYNQIANLYAQDAAEKNAVAQRERDRKASKNAVIGSAIGAVGNIAGAAIGSDPRLKEDVELVGESPSGIPIYEWKYIGEEGRYQGTMSTLVPAEAVVTNFVGEFDGVDYSKN